MNAHLIAIAAQIAATGIDVYDSTAERPVFDPRDWSTPLTSAEQAAWELPDTYAILTSPTLTKYALTVDNVKAPVRGYFQVTVAAVNPRQMHYRNELIRDALDGVRFQVAATHRAHSRMTSPGMSTVDKEVTPNRSYLVDGYRYNATPI